MGSGQEIGASDDRRTARGAAWLALALGLTAFAYVPALSGPFVRDDHRLIEQNPIVQSPDSALEAFGRSFWNDPAGPRLSTYYRPLATLSYVVDRWLWNGAPSGFHVTNLVLHLACATLVFALCRRGGATAMAAAAAAALFGTLPRLTEAVAWISGRTDLIAACGALLALLLHRSAPGATGRRIGAAAALLAGLLGKEVAVAGAAAIAAGELLEWRRAGGSLRRVALNLAPAGAACLLYAGLRLAARGATDPYDFFPLALRPVFALQALGSYVWMLVDPLRPRLAIGKLGIVDAWSVGLGASALAAGILAIRAARRRAVSPDAGASLALAAAALLPVLHLVPLPVTPVAADRFLYLPGAGLALAGAWAWTRLDGRPRRALAGIALAALCAFAVATYRRAGDWTDELRLWELAAERSHASDPLPHEELGTVLAWRGRPERALEHFETALRLEIEFVRHYPRASVGRNLRGNTALVLSEVGRYGEAIPILEQLVREQPHSPLHRLNLAAVQARALRIREAETELAAALRLHPGYALARQLLTQVRAAGALLARLPAPDPDESSAVRADRASAFALVGRLRDADRTWTQIAEAREVEPELLLRATRHLVLRGLDLQSADRALRRLHEHVGPVPEAVQLEGVLARRRHERGL
jgi:tetratricopeptide (TPR) repeat protein